MGRERRAGGRGRHAKPNVPCAASRAVTRDPCPTLGRVVALMHTRSAAGPPSIASSRHPLPANGKGTQEHSAVAQGVGGGQVVVFALLWLGFALKARTSAVRDQGL